MIDVDLVVLWVTVTLYVVLGGADFGAGFWNLVAGRGLSGRRVRDLIDEAIGPVWEVNHVWLIFGLVVLWTAYSRGFAAITSTLFDPLMLAVLAIVLRGAGFAFRHSFQRVRLQGIIEGLFAAASVGAPFFLGTVVGAIATGQVPAAGDGPQVSSWTSGTCLLIGAVFVGTCSWLGAVYLTVEARRRHADDLAAHFARRARGAGAVTGVVAVATLFGLHHDAHRIFHRVLDGPALPLAIASAVAVAAAFALVGRGTRGVRELAAGAVTLMLWAWGIAQYPYLLPRSLTVHAAASPEGSLVTVLVVFVVVLVVVIPSIGLLFTLAGRQGLVEDDDVVLGGGPRTTGPGA